MRSVFQFRIWVAGDEFGIEIGWFWIVALAVLIWWGWY